MQNQKGENDHDASTRKIRVEFRRFPNPLKNQASGIDCFIDFYRILASILTPIFHQNMPQKGAKLVQQNGQQQIIDRASQKVIVSAPAPVMRPGQPALAPQIVAALEADAQLKEPYFFDGGHPDAEGFRVFATAVEKWIVQQGWR